MNSHPSPSPHGAWQAAEVGGLVDLLMGGARQIAVVFTDERGAITGWSEGAFHITGFEPHEVMGRDIGLLFTPEDVAHEHHRHELRTAGLLGASEDERWHVRRDGSWFWASGVVLPRRTADERVCGYVKLFRDVTHLRTRTTALQNQVERLEKAQRDRQVFLATIAHELRNPLQPMAVAVEMLTHPSEAERHAQAIRLLRRQIGFMDRLIEDLIDMARVAEGRLQVHPARVELQGLLANAVDGCQGAAQAKGVHLLVVQPSVAVAVELDAGRIHQVVVNLLNNAIKFTPGGGQVVLLATADSTHCTIAVRDTGRGIGPELLPRIFDMFTQGEGAGTARGDGLGIGLALVKEIVALHQGTVEVRSEGAGKGSEFRVRLPLRRPGT
ncbi:ATP-binding protein [Ideonella sp.]|uniref:PAS domain-containing sensor histidine kinase n=1 Tax=Ideonella sp. TaxID=1929293 RepID=UPI0035B18652